MDATLWAILKGALRCTLFISLGVLRIVAISHIMCAASRAQAFLGCPWPLAVREILVSIMLADFTIRAVSSPFCWYRRLRYSMKVCVCLSASETPCGIGQSCLRLQARFAPLHALHEHPQCLRPTCNLTCSASLAGRLRKHRMPATMLRVGLPEL